MERGAAAVVGEARPEICARLTARAEEAGAEPVVVTGRDWQVRDISVGGAGTSFTLVTSEGERRLTTPLIGEFQAHNACVALAMLRGAGGHWREIERNAAALLPQVRLAGRFHRSDRWLFDVAHNADGAATVAANLLEVGAPLPVSAVVCVLRDKDWAGILRALRRDGYRGPVGLETHTPARQADSHPAIRELIRLTAGV